jgi:hypothetical protein
MDDHFDRRMARSGITDPEGAARRVLDAARETGGVAVVDYHSRGMNRDFYPRYGPWLERFAERNFDATLAFRTPMEIVEEYERLEAALAAASVDRTADAPAPVVRVPLSIERMRREDVADVARLHVELFGDAATSGQSVATLGTGFLERGFYGPNVDNPHFHCDVARVEGRAVAFSIYALDRERVFGHTLRRHFPALLGAGIGTGLRHPFRVLAFAGNLRYGFGERLDFLEGVQGWWIVAGSDPEYRTPRWEERLGTRVVAAMFDRMERTFRERGVRSWYGVVRPDNIAINKFLQRRGLTVAGRARAQGLDMVYYVKRYDDVGADAGRGAPDRR